MPRKGHTSKRTVPADAVYGSNLVTKFINSMMWQGKRSTAEGIFYEAVGKGQEKGGDEALKLFKKAIENAKPLLEVKTRRVGGANYQVPVEVNPDRRTSLAIRWMRRTTGAPRSRRRKTSTAWPKPTRRSRTIGGSRDVRVGALGAGRSPRSF